MQALDFRTRWHRPNACWRARARVVLAVALVWAPTGVGAQVKSTDCPQPRFTGKAPDEYYARVNPLSGASHEAAGERTYLGAPAKVTCATCHGARGDGKGQMAELFDPPPRNFACARTIKDVPDGQLFWIIRFGSPGTAMVGDRNLSDEQVWQLVLYLRKLAR